MIGSKATLYYEKIMMSGFWAYNEANLKKFNHDFLQKY